MACIHQTCLVLLQQTQASTWTGSSAFWGVRHRDPALLGHSMAHPKMLRAGRGQGQHVPRAHSSHHTEHELRAVERNKSLFPPQHHPALPGSFAGGAEHRAGPQHPAFAHTGFSAQTDPLLVIFPTLVETQHFRLRAQVSEPLRAEVCDGNDDTPRV